MSNLIPPLLSCSPPPIVGPLDEDEDEFGDFRAAANSFDYDDFSAPSSPHKSTDTELKTDCSMVNLDINSNKSEEVLNAPLTPSENLNGSIFEQDNKDFQDRRKSLNEIVDFPELNHHENEVNSSNYESTSQENNSEIKKEDCVLTVVEDNAIEESNQQPFNSFIRDDCLKHQDSKQNFSNIDTEELHKDVDSVEKKSVNVESPSTENMTKETIFDIISGSVQEQTSSPTYLSETNEIKSDDYLEQIGDESTEQFKTKQHKIDESETGPSLTDVNSKLSDEDFGDFANHFENEVLEEENVMSEDDFDEFVTSENVDDFGDFESSQFPTSTNKLEFLDIDEKSAADKSETILKDIFPTFVEKTHEFQYSDETKRDAIFHELKDVTETKALIYQWSKSNSQKLFFKALNIDTRNILYGPAWNSAMPRFAANLGLTPLEPVKSEILNPTPVHASSSSNSSQKNGDIPTAQFDWSGSGLINPLDYSQTMLLDLEQLVASLDIPSTTHPNSNTSPSPNELLDEWDCWLQAMSSEVQETVPENSSPSQIQSNLILNTLDKTEPMPSLFEKPNTEASISLENEFNNFTKPSDNLSPLPSPKLIPLRETHISSELDVNKPGWLQPTLLTPDLPRKEAVVAPVEDDEFDDFQMVLPEEKKEETHASEFTNKVIELDVSNKVPSSDITLHSKKHIFGDFLNSGPNNSSDHTETNKVTNDEDEFTDFHSSLPQTQILQPLQPIAMEPLKPIVQYTQPATQINWPDPGVTDEDIQNIELSYSRKAEREGKDQDKEKELIKENSLEEDEWTDFVSVTNPVKGMLPDRTATPDLPLSVLNLNHVQAPKQPIPVITPSGLVQTKLSSNMSLDRKLVVQTRVQPNLFKPPTTHFQPSIISSQYAANFPGTSTSLSSTKTGQSQDDDDDWSEFVSSQPPPQNNGYQQKTTFNQGKVPPVNWTSATANIIMNPTHFETFPNYGPPQNKKVTAVPPRHVISSISAIPDLDFIAPRNRTSKK